MPNISAFPDPDKLTVTLARSNSERKIAQAIRRKVFVQEQGVREEDEIDGRDGTAIHYLAFLDGVPIGTARSRDLKHSNVKVERVSIIKEFRGFGWGHIFMEKILCQLVSQGHDNVVIHAQVAVIPFYERLNFTTVGSEFIEAGIIHIQMITPIGVGSLTDLPV